MGNGQMEGRMIDQIIPQIQLPSQLHTSISPEMRQEVVPVQNNEQMTYLKKPDWKTGLWTSSWVDNTSAWVDYCRGLSLESPLEQQDKLYWHILSPKPARIFVINTYQDLDRLLKTYLWQPDKIQHLNEVALPSDTNGNILIAPMMSLLASPTFVSIDFERISQDYDGIWLTSQGERETHFPLFEEQNLTHWSCESTIWFRWCFDTVECIKTPVTIK